MREGVDGGSSRAGDPSHESGIFVARSAIDPECGGTKYGYLQILRRRQSVWSAPDATPSHHRRSLLAADKPLVDLGAELAALTLMEAVEFTGLSWSASQSGRVDILEFCITQIASD